MIYFLVKSVFTLTLCLSLLFLIETEYFHFPFWHIRCKCSWSGSLVWCMRKNVSVNIGQHQRLSWRHQYIDWRIMQGSGWKCCNNRGKLSALVLHQYWISKFLTIIEKNFTLWSLMISSITYWGMDRSALQRYIHSLFSHTWGWVWRGWTGGGCGLVFKSSTPLCLPTFFICPLTLNSH